ncbi:hypothetical protein TBK1r_26150 [Stieleria magnilauensis]|uniref:Uncharacterized protein n=1 Tax=Stieleria magnilauensis TaxID=2527963 RepID=A0ABX5XNT6_9BACT|nr:hypothetical protein TBK1r_26150 [Planctomycetes bacterium TBK1r]
MLLIELMVDTLADDVGMGSQLSLISENGPSAQGGRAISQRVKLPGHNGRRTC